MAAYVLDTSAILALLNTEPGHETVWRVLREAEDQSAPAAVYLPFMALMEAEYLMLRRHSQEDTDRFMALILSWPAQVVESNPAWRRQAAAIKASRRLSVADAWIAGLALVLGASLVHRDPEFDRLEGLRAVRLPS